MATATQTMVKPAHQRATTLAHPARHVETRATTTSVVTFAFTPFRIEASGKRAEPDDFFARVGNASGREEAFRAALDHHTAEYRKHHAAAACDAGQARFAIFRTLGGFVDRPPFVRTETQHRTGRVERRDQEQTVDFSTAFK
jgi:hypothetical protein